MQRSQRILLIVLIALLVVTGAGLALTTEWGSRTVSTARSTSTSKLTQSPVDLSQFRNTQSLAELAATPQEQDLARDALRKADHEVDFAFAGALYQAAARQVNVTPEIKAIQERVTKSEADDAALTADVARLTKEVEAAKDNQKEALTQQLDLAKSRQELTEDELADAHEDLERAGGDPQNQVQRMIDEYNASEQASGGQLDLGIVGKQAGSALPASYSFISRAHTWYTLQSIVARLNHEEQTAAAAVARLAARHDQLEKQLEQAQAQQSQKLPPALPPPSPAGTPASPAPGVSTQTKEAISSYKSLTVLQKRLSGLDSRIRNDQDLEGVYAQWSALVAARRRDLMHGLLISVALILGIGIAVLVTSSFS